MPPITGTVDPGVPIPFHTTLPFTSPRVDQEVNIKHHTSFLSHSIAPGVWKSFLHETLGCKTGLLTSRAEGLPELAQIVATFTTKFEPEGIRGITFRTDSFQLGSAGCAKLQVPIILTPAFWTLHVLPPTRLRIRICRFSLADSAYGFASGERRTI